MYLVFVNCEQNIGMPTSTRIVLLAIEHSKKCSTTRHLATTFGMHFAYWNLVNQIELNWIESKMREEIKPTKPTSTTTSTTTTAATFS